MKKEVKSYEELSKEGEARWEKLKAFTQAQPDYEAIAAEVNAGIDAAFAMERARKEAGLTQAQVAERMGTTQSSVARMLKGRLTLASFARYLAACGKRAEITIHQL